MCPVTFRCALATLTHHLQGAVGQLHAEGFEGPEEVESEGVRVLPAADQQPHLHPPQDQRLPQHLVDQRPVPAGPNRFRPDQKAAPQPLHNRLVLAKY